jgi:hypothetical protein
LGETEGLRFQLHRESAPDGKEGGGTPACSLGKCYEDREGDIKGDVGDGNQRMLKSVF